MLSNLADDVCISVARTVIILIKVAMMNFIVVVPVLTSILKQHNPVIRCINNYAQTRRYSAIHHLRHGGQYNEADARLAARRIGVDPILPSVIDFYVEQIVCSSSIWSISFILVVLDDMSAALAKDAVISRVTMGVCSV